MARCPIVISHDIKRCGMSRLSWIMIVLVGVAILSLLPHKTAAAGAPRITAEELNAKLDDPDVIIIDVRRAGHWQGSDQKIAGAVREDPKNIEAWAGNYAHDKTLVLYCA
jgi:predicted sulfurtransferase